MNLQHLKCSPATAIAGGASPSTATADNPACSNCGSKNRWLLHNVQLRGIDRRLCTSCVLRLHPSFFCPFCFEFFDRCSSATSSAGTHRFVSCIQCSSLAHTHCLPSPPPPPQQASSFLCPSCSKPDSSFFGVDGSDPNADDAHRVLDKRLALVLLCAARIASASMNRAVNAARLKADRSLREAAAARKRAREALERFVAVNRVKPVVDGPLEVSECRKLRTGNDELDVRKKFLGLNAASERQNFYGSR